MPNRVLACSFPFPPQDPPVQVSAACEFCPNANRAILDLHATIKRSNRELNRAIRSFIEWLIEKTDSSEAPESIVRYATELYTRADHTGTCVPKTVLFAIYKSQQFDPYTQFAFTENARRALAGQPCAAWPTGEERSGPTWDQMFATYTTRYEGFF